MSYELRFRERALAKVLILVAVFAAGFYLDRWQHRPIELTVHVVRSCVAAHVST